MSASHVDSDRIAAVSRGESRWTGDETAHLDRCAVCRLEWELVGAAPRLGRAESAGIDAPRVAAAVLQRLANEPRPAVGRWSRRTGWVVALGAAAVLALAVLLPRGEPAAVPAEPAIAVLHELDDLSSAELEAVLETIPPAADEALHVEAAPLSDLSVPDLERMLRAME
jgi:hypothetical protein